MFKSVNLVKTVKKVSKYIRKTRSRYADCFVSFSDSTGRVISFIGIGDLARSKGNVYKVSLYRVSSTRVAARIHDEAGTGIATYIGNATGPADEVYQLHLAMASSPYVRSLFHKNSTESFSPTILYADATSFRGGVG